MNKNKFYIINPIYKISGDVKRCIVTNNNSIFLDEKWGKNARSFTWKLHPYLAYIFSHFDGNNTLNEIVSKISKQFDVDENYLLDVFFPNNR